MFCDLMEEFQGWKVIEFTNVNDWRGPGFAYRLREEYDDETSIVERLETLLEQPGVEEVKALVIGAWSGAFEGGNSSDIVAALAESAEELTGIRALFLGDIVMEESELSWINQSNIAPLFEAFPNLEVLRVRGGNQLELSPLKHDHLKELVIETGGLPRSFLKDLFQCDFSGLERLELLLGEANYGFDGSVADLQPLFSGNLFPSLKSLGLTNSEIENEIAEAVVQAPIADRIEVLDLSMGTLDDTGLGALHRLAGKPNLKHLIISHHYASEEGVSRLRSALPFEVTADDPQEPEDDWRPILHAE